MTENAELTAKMAFDLIHAERLAFYRRINTDRPAPSS